jgi:hypothetical protein
MWAAMATAPATLTLSRHRDRQGRPGPWIRWVFLGLLAAIPIAALLDVFGQRTVLATNSTAAARLTLLAPSDARGGLMYAARFRIDAHRELKSATLVLAPGWADQYTVNGTSPQPSSESSQNGRIAFSLGDIPQGHIYTEFVSLQVNPTNVGNHVQTVWLYNGKQQVAVIHHTITIWP